MPLQPKLQVLSLSKDKTTITVKDITGDYNAVTNPGGFNNPGDAHQLVRSYYGSAVIRINYFDNDVYYDKEIQFPQFIQLIDPESQGGLAITAADFGIPGGVFLDGVYDIEYYLGIPGDNGVVGDVGTTHYVLMGGDFADPLYFDGMFLFDNNYGNKFYLFDKTLPFSNNSGYFTKPLVLDAVWTSPPIPASEYSWLIKGPNTKLLVKETGRQRLNNDISLWNLAGCPEEDPYEVLKRFKYKLAMETQFAKGHFLDAHVAAQYLQG